MAMSDIVTAEQGRRELVTSRFFVWNHTDSSALIVPDRTFIRPSPDELSQFVHETWFEFYKYMKEVFDCDDFALEALGYSRQLYVRDLVLMFNATAKEEIADRKFEYPWFIGEGHGWIAGKNNHAANWSWCDDNKLYIIEPQNDRIRERTDDRCYFVRV